MRRDAGLITEPEWRERNGGICAKTAKNWEGRQIIGAPLRIAGRRYRRADEVPRFDDAQDEAGE